MLDTPEPDKPADSSADRPDPKDTSRLQDLRLRRGSPAAGRDAFVTLVSSLQEQIVAELGSKLDFSDAAQARAAIQEKLERILADEKLILNRNEKRQVVEAILRELTPGSNAAKL